MTVRMTREQFDRIQVLQEKDYNFGLAVVFTRDKVWSGSSFLNNITPLEFATAWIAPEKVEIIEPELTWSEAIQIVLDGGKVFSFNAPGLGDQHITLNNLDSYFLSIRIKFGKWRKAESK